MDTQIWYAIYSTLYGGIVGAFDRLGEVVFLNVVSYILLWLFINCSQAIQAGILLVYLEWIVCLPLSLVKTWVTVAGAGVI